MSQPAKPAPDDDLLAKVHAELRAIAQRQMAGERTGHTLQATALVHEAFLRLRDQVGAIHDAPGRFYLAAAEAMRRILIDHARRHGSHKRGGSLDRLPLDMTEIADTVDFEQMLMIDDAIRCLEELSSRTAKVVRLRFFTGLSEIETADALGLSERTVRREWTFARAWLYRTLKDSEAK